MNKNCFFVLVLSFVLFAGERIDFREAILNHGIRISISEKEISANQCLLFRTQPTWVVGIYHNNEWNNTVVLRNNKYNQITNTPYSVKLNGSLSVLINDNMEAKPKSTIQKLGHNFVTNKDKKNVFLLNCFGVIIIFIIVYKVFSKKKVIKK